MPKNIYMILSNGFYAYLMFQIYKGVKYQDIKSIFKYSTGIINKASFCCDDNDSTSCHVSLSLEKTEITSDSNIYDLIFNNRDLFLANTMIGYHEEAIKFRLDIGERYKNIYRPLLHCKVGQEGNSIANGVVNSDIYTDPPIINRIEYCNRLNQLEILIDDLKSIFKVIAPTQNNLKSYGHAIRNLIIIACTEIDDMMSIILKNNGIESIGSFYNMNDYIKLCIPLACNKYSISFSRFQELGAFSPFKKWDMKEPTKSLEWFNAYNQIKHNNELNFHLANIENAINSVTAFAIILIAQYGYRNNLWDEKLGKVFTITDEPQWRLEDLYVPQNIDDHFQLTDEKYINYSF